MIESRIDARSIRHDGLMLPGIVAASAVAWVALIAWSWAPGAEHGGHHAHHGAQAGGSTPGVFVLLAAWGLMTVAMMLPAAAPYFLRFRRAIASDRDSLALAVVAIAGYLAIWMAFGAALVAGDLALHQAFDRVAGLDGLTAQVGPATVAIAGLWQVSTAGRYHLYRPYVSRAAGVDARVAAWPRALRCGLAHGVDCAGSCGPLMLLMLALGHDSIAAMALLGAVMFAVKNTPWGHALRVPIGFAMLAGTLLLLVV